MKFAVFDVDGTLVKGSAGADFVSWLVERKKFPKKNSEEIAEAIEKNKKELISYEERGRIATLKLAQGFKGKSQKEIQSLAFKFVRTYDKVFPGSVGLVNFLKKEGFYLIILSRSFREILKALNSRLGFDCIISTEFEVIEGKFTGKVSNKMWDEKIKGKKLLEKINKKNFNLRDSFAFGDSEQDSFMMDLVEHPVCLNPNGNLNKVCKNRGWKSFDDLKDLVVLLEEGKIIAQRSWFEHYSMKYKKLIMDEKMFGSVLKKEKAYLDTVKKYTPAKGRILEAGCGLGRIVSALSLMDYKITAIDNDPRLLEITKINSKNYGKKRNIELKEMDFFEIKKKFKKDSFDAVTHQGVLEHFSPLLMKKLLDLQLQSAPLVIFSVPLKTEKNKEYFRFDQIGYRNLWEEEKWAEFLLDYKIKEFFTAEQRTDNLIVVLGRK